MLRLNDVRQQSHEVLLKWDLSEAVVLHSRSCFLSLVLSLSGCGYVVVILLGLILHIHFASITVNEDGDCEQFFEIYVDNEFFDFLTKSEHD